jgi:hypothetical protein
VDPGTASIWAALIGSVTTIVVTLITVKAKTSDSPPVSAGPVEPESASKITAPQQARSNSYRAIRILGQLLFVLLYIVGSALAFLGVTGCSGFLRVENDFSSDWPLYGLTGGTTLLGIFFLFVADWSRRRFSN